MLKSFRIFVLALLAGFALNASAQDAPPVAGSSAETGTGTLVVDVLPFRSEKDLPKKVVKQLEKGGLEWGIRDRQLVFTMVAKQHIDFPVMHLTRYGSNESLTLPVGEYRVTGIGLEMNTAFSVEKVLEKGAYVNEDIVVFKIEPGKTTTLSIVPQIMIDRTFVLNFWMPSMMASVNDGTATTAPISLNDRNDRSITWPNYNGPLKFTPKK